MLVIHIDTCLWDNEMTAKINPKLKIILLVIIAVVVIMPSVTLGIWYGVKNRDNKPASHPNVNWSFRLSGSKTNNPRNISISETLDMPFVEQNYVVKGKTEEEALFKGVTIAYLLQNKFATAPDASTIVFIAEDQYTLSFLIVDLQEGMLLAYAKDGSYLENAQNGGNGYLRLIDPQIDENDFNGPRCLKTIVEIRIN